MHTHTSWVGKVSFAQHVTGTTPHGPFKTGKKVLTEDILQYFLFESVIDLNGPVNLNGFGQGIYSSNYHSAVTSHPENLCNVPDQRSIDRNLILIDRRGGRSEDGPSVMFWQMSDGNHLLSFRTLSIPLESRRFERHDFTNLCASHQSRSGPYVSEPWANKGETVNGRQLEVRNPSSSSNRVSGVWSRPVESGPGGNTGVRIVTYEFHRVNPG